MWAMLKLKSLLSHAHDSELRFSTYTTIGKAINGLVKNLPQGPPSSLILF